MALCALNSDKDGLWNSATLGVITHATLQDDPIAGYPDLGTLFEVVSTFEVGAHWGMVLSNSDVAVLSFRGTDSNLEWAQSFTYKQIPWREGKAHAGFVRALEQLWEHVLASLFDAGAIEGEKTLWVTGHSLGGALALLAADRLVDMGVDVHEVQTYGTPQVFDPVAAQSYGVPTLRFINNEDPIPQLHWPTLFDVYEHVGVEHFLLASGALARGRHSRDLAQRIDRAYSIGEGILPAGMIHDHFMREYLRKLRALSLTTKTGI